jgi:single-stranded-DNA-specific exonuclease
LKKWFLYNKKADFQGIAAKFGIDPVTARILRNREVNSESQIRNFLSGTLEDGLHSPLLLPDAIRCMNNLDRCIREGRKIRIVGDYDVDGVCATYILFRGLKHLGADVDYQIPDRIRDGYGINRSIIDRAKADGIYMILTCDNGISAVEELKHARELGLNVIVTDHHDVRQKTDEDYGCESRDILPPAAAVVDAKRESSRYPFPEICGAVVAWKMIQLLYQKRNLPVEESMEFLEFAAIATVCDVVRLQDENRLIVKYGLQRIKETSNPGLAALLEITGLSEQEKISTYHIGFVLGPCINAGGRLESAVEALALFLAEDRAEAYERAVRLKSLNDVRKDMTMEACKEAFQQVEETYASDRVLVVYLPDLHESLAGIVAGRLKERYYRPSFVITNAEDSDDGTRMAKGSGRSIESYPMSEKLKEVSRYLTKWGGHPMAAGFSLKRSDIDAFRAALNSSCSLSREELVEKLWIDVPMPVDYITFDLIHDFDKLEPFGTGNPKPLFATKGLTIAALRVLGQKHNVVKLELVSGTGRRITGLIFSDVDRFMQEKEQNHHIDVVYYPDINEYNGRQELQIIINDYQFKP